MVLPTLHSLICRSIDSKVLECLRLRSLIHLELDVIPHFVWVCVAYIFHLLDSILISPSCLEEGIFIIFSSVGTFSSSSLDGVEYGVEHSVTASYWIYALLVPCIVDT